MERKQHIIDEWTGIGYTLCSQKRQVEAHRPAGRKRKARKGVWLQCVKSTPEMNISQNFWSSTGYIRTYAENPQYACGENFVYEPRASMVLCTSRQIYYRYIGVIKIVDYGSSTTYYMTDGLSSDAKKREKTKMEKRIAVAKEKVKNSEAISA